MKKESNKICNICNLSIDESKEFARLTHFKKKDQILTEAFYHINCYKTKLASNQDSKKLQAVAFKTIMDCRDKLGLGEVC